MMGPRAARKLPHYGDMFWYFGMWARAEAPHAYAAQSYRRPVADTRRAGGSPFLASPASKVGGMTSPYTAHPAYGLSAQLGNQKKTQKRSPLQAPIPLHYQVERYDEVGPKGLYLW